MNQEEIFLFKLKYTAVSLKRIVKHLQADDPKINCDFMVNSTFLIYNKDYTKGLLLKDGYYERGSLQDLISKTFEIDFNE